MRNDVVEMVEDHQLYVDEDEKFVELPQKYRKCSSGGDVLIYQDEEYVVGFWVKGDFWTMDLKCLFIPPQIVLRMSSK